MSSRLIQIGDRVKIATDKGAKMYIIGRITDNFIFASSYPNDIQFIILEFNPNIQKWEAINHGSHTIEFLRGDIRTDFFALPEYRDVAKLTLLELELPQLKDACKRYAKHLCDDNIYKMYIDKYYYLANDFKLPDQTYEDYLTILDEFIEKYGVSYNMSNLIRYTHHNIIEWMFSPESPFDKLKLARNFMYYISLFDHNLMFIFPEDFVKSLIIKYPELFLEAAVIEDYPSMLRRILESGYKPTKETITKLYNIPYIDDRIIEILNQFETVD